MQWKLKVKNFGKIKEAEVRSSSMRFFVGNNNSGKSYLMTLLWGLEKANLPLLNISYELPSWIDKDWLRKIMDNKDKQEYLLSDYTDIINWYINLILSTIKLSYVKRLFNAEVRIDELTINFSFSNADKFTIQQEIGSAHYNVCVNSNTEHLNLYQLQNESDDKYKGKIDNLLISSLIQLIWEESFQSIKNSYDYPIYLPSSRTGFMLTKDIINKAGRRAAFADEKTQYEPFTMPIIDFLDAIDWKVNLEQPSKQLESIYNLIEQKMLHGRFIINDTPNKTLLFNPSGTNERLPLRVASSVVTEISPLYLLLKADEDYPIKSVYYEEPEICLHPSLQQVMARILIKMVNAGINLNVATHSEKIIQHINNMLTLAGNNPRRNEIMERYGYSEDDLLSNIDISMYQFKENEDGTTTLEELKRGEYGFIVPTFNDALDNILEEVYTIQEDESEGSD